MNIQRLSLDGGSYGIFLPHAETDYIQGKIAREKLPYELEMLRDMASRLQADDLVLDVGANIGNHSLYLAAIAQARVEAFEPNAELCEALRRSVALNNLENRLVIHQAGVADTPGFAHFDRLDESNLGAQSLEVSSGQDGISLVALDQFEWSTPVRMIKVDVEGMELQVLHGAEKLIARDHPILYIEAQAEPDFTALSELLLKWGYQFCSSFNATPTHLFVHESELERWSDLGRYLLDSAYSVYQTKHDLSELRTKLSDSNRKYRELNERFAELKQKLEAQTKRTQELYQRAEQLNKELKQARQLQSEAQRSLAIIRSSATYKAGLYMRAASRSLNAAIKLPLRLWRLRKLERGVLPAIDGASAHVSLPSAAKAVDRTTLFIDSLVTKPAQEIRVACIMDDFTYGSYQPECDLHQLTPQSWEAELEACKPELLFIESAWRGKDELWGSKVGHCSQELQGIVAWCRERHIPTIFWNKEDPVHFETFLTTAKLFDFVFTTDMDCIHRYKAALGHERVYFLPFACQPKVHNPIEKYTRKDAFCFAGAYYVRYPERTRDLESFVEELPAYRPLEIYDRNFGKDDPNYQFPDAYQPYIVGTLPFSEIDKAYKGYRYAINLNSIKQSQTMFARRVYELLGSNTLTISNYSRGVRLMFGDLVITSDSGTEIKRRLEQLDNGNRLDRLRLAGLRKAMAEHTYADRLNYILNQVTGKPRVSALPAFNVIATAKTLEDVRSIAAHVSRQAGVKVTLTLMARRGLDIKEAEALLQELSMPFSIRRATSLRGKNLLDLTGDEQGWVAAMLPEDYYGPRYLHDMALATRYSPAPVVGKAAWHICTIDKENTPRVELHNAEEAYLSVNFLYARCAAIAPAVAKGIKADKWLASLNNWQYDQPEQLAIDPYNYCQNVAPEHWQPVQQHVDDLPVDNGIALQSLTELAEQIVPMQNGKTRTAGLNGNQLAQLLTDKGLNTDAASVLALPDEKIRLTRNAAIQTRVSGATLDIDSTLPDGKHEYLYAAKDVETAEVTGLVEGSNCVPLHLEVDPGLNLSLVILFLDAKKERLGNQILLPNRNVQVDIPDGTVFLRFGLRVYAGGSTRIKRLLFGHLSLEPLNVLGQADILLLTNHYPSYDDLYRNGFVHSRVKAYAERGVPVDVFRLRKDEPISWHEFQGIDVTSGSQQALSRMLDTGRYHHVLVHFLDLGMWEVLKDFIDDIQITVWVHGSEVQPWWRREYNYEDARVLEKAKAESDARLAFWRSIFSKMPDNLKFVFVSRYFADEVMEDIGISLNSNQYKIIHNPIDTDVFTYQAKDPEQRKKILSIRPYASRKYANDLSIKAVLELSKEPFFPELSFKFIGDGSLFEETLAPIRGFKNISIERRFLSQQEIASIHKEYGVFLCPTRMDAQGVSKDEAMSSGLVVVTNGVAAIPEFVDESCGILAPGEDFISMADGIKMLFLKPRVFSEMSENATKRVEQQTRKSLIIDQELNLILKTPDVSLGGVC